MHVIFLVAFLIVGAFLRSTEAGLTKSFVSRYVQEGGKNADGGNTWALLVAGSNGYMNYRHQADVCHAYQILKAHGLDDDHIVVMMYDDIAHNLMNPEKGKLYNEPNGPDVYAGVPKDYTKGKVTPTNFLKVLQGLTTGGTSEDEAGEAGYNSGKVIDSTSVDDIFVYFADHGGGHSLGFPSIFGVVPRTLHASDLENAIKSMHAGGKYRQMVMYIEACFSGSMFADWLPPTSTPNAESLNLYVVTAATPHESSWACYNSKKVHSYLGDCFSNHWMEDDDNHTSTFAARTFSEQFDAVVKNTWTSTPCHYGDLSIADSPLSTFEGASANKTRVVQIKKERKLRGQHDIFSAVQSQDVDLALALSQGDANAIARERAKRQTADATAKKLIDALVYGSEATSKGLTDACTGSSDPNELECYSRCGGESKSHDCAEICCGKSSEFFPTNCRSVNGGRGGEKCYLNCCEESGESILEACMNATSTFRSRCSKECCGTNVCSQSSSFKGVAGKKKRESITACYKDLLDAVVKSCPRFLASDYAMIQYSGLLRSFCSVKVKHGKSFTSRDFNLIQNACAF